MDWIDACRSSPSSCTWSERFHMLDITRVADKFNIVNLKRIFDAFMSNHEGATFSTCASENEIEGTIENV